MLKENYFPRGSVAMAIVVEGTSPTAVSVTGS